jgi:hypothetical protein
MNSPVNLPTGSSHKVPEPNGTMEGMQSNEMNRLPAVKAVAVLLQVSHSMPSSLPGPRSYELHGV